MPKIKESETLLKANPHLRWNWRKKKKNLVKLAKELSRKGCKVTILNSIYSSNPRTRYSADVDGVSLLNGSGTSCSLYSCGPKPLTKEEAEERVEFAKQFGHMPYLKKYIYDIQTKEQEEELEKMYKEWGMPYIFYVEH